MTIIAVVNKSSMISDADVNLMVAACDYQITHHLAPLYNRSWWHVKAFTKTQVVPTSVSYFQVIIMDDPDQANALGYHTEDMKGVWGRVFVKPVLHAGGTALRGTLSVSSVLSHEVCEMFCDKNVNAWVDRTDGTFVALEVCDPVENDAYVIPVNDPSGKPVDVSVSNFVLNAWFDAQAPATSRFDYLHKVHAPLTMSVGGYMVVLNTKTGNVTEVFGDSVAENEHDKKKPFYAGSRSYRRQNKPGT